jgi:hypothetical protein
VRAVTAAVLVLGTLLEAVHQSFGKVEHATVFLVVYIPLCMLGSQWGETWSLDALLARRAGRSTTSPSDDHWRHALPMRIVLLVLALLFASSAFSKAVLGDWLTAPDLMTNLLLGKNVEAAREGLPSSAILPFVVAHPLVSAVFRYGLLLFEALAVSMLLGGRIRDAYVAAALVFHAVNALLLIVTFTPILVVYGLFVDWQAAVERVARRTGGRRRWLARMPSWLLVAGTLAIASLAGASCNAAPGLRSAIQLGGRLDWRTIWYPVLPVALAWWVRALCSEAKRV